MKYSRISAFIASSACLGMLYLVAPTFTLAATPKPAASPTTSPAASAEPEVSTAPATQSLKERIQRVVQQNQDKIKGVIDNLGQKPRGFYGEVSRVTEEAISITSPKGTEIISITDGTFTLPVLKQGKLIKSTDIVVGDWATVIGYAENDSFMPRKVILTNTITQPTDFNIVIGSIQELTGLKLTIQPRQVGSAAEVYTLTTTSSIEDLAGNTVKQSAIQEQIQALVVAVTDSKGVKTIKKIRLLTTIQASPSPSTTTRR